jgi:RNA polymerase sigma-70 factor (ECF subfamily)
LRSSGRRSENAQIVPESRPAAPEADAFVQADTRNAVREALGDLPEQQRTALELAYFQGMSHSEITAALNQPLGTVKDRIRNGMLHLKKRLKAYL